MDIRGMLYDVGRDQGGKEAFYEQMIQRLVDYGYNMLVLNLEYRFQFPSHPEVAMPDSLTPETVRRLDVYAKERGIELVPFMNCAGHCNGIGLTEKYNTLCADDSNSTKAVEQLRINLPEAEALMLDLYEDLYVSFSSKYFHIGGDEIRHLNVLYPNLEPKERIREAIRYLNKMCAHVKAQGRIPMIWGDMLLKYPELIEQVDQEAIICDWNSFTAPYLKPVSNRKTLSCFKEQNKSTIFSNAVSSWIGNPMISDNTTQNIVFASREYQEIFGEDAKGILTNVWQIEYGGCFDVVWPWLYLQSRVNQGEQRDCRSMEFLKEYTTLEWGVAPEDDSLMKWYRLVDTEVSKAVLYEAFMDQSLRPVLEEMGNRPYKLFRWFFSSLFHTENILPLLHAERKKWLNGHLLEQIESLL